MKEEKQKRYLCELSFLDDVQGFKAFFYIIGIITSAILIVILLAYLNFNYNPKITNSDWQSSYIESQEKYYYLYNIFNDVVHEGERPNVEAIPDDVFYELIDTRNNVILHYYIDSEEGSQTIYNMNITFSNDMHIVNTECGLNLESEEEYKESFYRELRLTALFFGTIQFSVLFFFYLVALCISKAHKSIDEHEEIEKMLHS